MLQYIKYLRVSWKLLTLTMLMFLIWVNEITLYKVRNINYNVDSNTQSKYCSIFPNCIYIVIQVKYFPQIQCKSVNNQFSVVYPILEPFLFVITIWLQDHPCLLFDLILVIIRYDVRVVRIDNSIIEFYQLTTSNDKQFFMECNGSLYSVDNYSVRFIRMNVLYISW